MSTSLGTLPNARHCHINDVVTAQQMTTKLLPAWIRGQGKAVPLQSEEIAFFGEYGARADGQQSKHGERPRLFAIHDR